MDEMEAKLVSCFSSVFPRLNPADVPAASAANMPGWDSVAQINLLVVIGEEFGIEIDFEQFEGATSFPELLDRVRQITAAR